MKSNLYIIQNMMIFIEECMIKEPEYGDSFIINTNYLKNENDINKLRLLIKKIYPYIIEKDINIVKDEYNYIYSSSNLKSINNVLDNIIYKEHILVEDGLYDYLDNNDNVYDNKMIYVFYPDYINNNIKRNAKKIYKLDLNNIPMRFKLYFLNELSVYKENKKGIPVLYTRPLKEDYNLSNNVINKALQYLDNNYNEIYIKKHPRDLLEYKSDKLKIIEINKNIPSQIIDIYFAGPKYFLLPDTTFFETKGNNKNILKISNDKKYLNDFDIFNNVKFIDINPKIISI